MTRRGVKGGRRGDSYGSEQRGNPRAHQLFLRHCRRGIVGSSKVLRPWVDNEREAEAVLQEYCGLLFRLLKEEVNKSLAQDDIFHSQ